MSSSVKYLVLTILVLLTTSFGTLAAPAPLYSCTVKIKGGPVMITRFARAWNKIAAALAKEMFLDNPQTDSTQDLDSAEKCTLSTPAVVVVKRADSIALGSFLGGMSLSSCVAAQK